MNSHHNAAAGILTRPFFPAHGVPIMSSPMAVSFEFFPPADEVGARQLSVAVQRLAPLAPRFASVTYGADGSTRSRTPRCVEEILRETSLCVAPHLTCIGAKKEEIQAMAKGYWHAGIRHVVALRGDGPAGAPGHRDLSYASDLVGCLKDVANFEISVACYPEGHAEQPGVEADITNLKRKIDAGASRAITQFCFDTDTLLRYRDRCVAAGIKIPIVPGILPITRFPQLLRFAARCAATVPQWLRQRFEGLDDDEHTRSLLAAHVAVDQVERLRQQGVEQFHFYTLNRADLTYAICHAIGIRSTMATGGRPDRRSRWHESGALTAPPAGRAPATRTAIR